MNRIFIFQVICFSNLVLAYETEKFLNDDLAIGVSPTKYTHLIHARIIVLICSIGGKSDR